MKAIIVDASVAASWFLADELSAYSEAVLERVNTDAAMLVPPLWLVEITNVLLMAERRGRIEKKLRDAAFAEIQRLPLTIGSSASVAGLAQLAKLAEKHHLTAYDAEYLRLAQEMKAPLATQDKALMTAAKKERVALLEDGG